MRPVLVLAASAALAVFALGCASHHAPVTVPAAAEPSLSTWGLSGRIYSVKQSRRGEEIFLSTCVRCHRADLSGSQIVPPLVGEKFLSRWSTKTAGDLFEWVRTSMPPGTPTARLPADEYADILAYVIRMNGFPAGRRAMPADFETLRVIRIGPPSDDGIGGGPAASVEAKPRPGDAHLR